MIISKAIQACLDSFVDKLSSSTLPFPIEPYYVFDPELDFLKIGQQYIARSDIFEKIEGEVPNEWVLLLWNRGDITPSINPRLARDTFNPNAKTTQNMKQIKIPLELSFVCNNIDLAERLEEELVLSFQDINIGFTFQLSEEFSIEPISGKVVTSDGISFNRGVLQNSGSLTSINFNIEILFPLVSLPKEAKEIREINFNLWHNDTILMSEKILPEV